jgi:hypothetical protein
MNVMGCRVALAFIEAQHYQARLLHLLLARTHHAITETRAGRPVIAALAAAGMNGRASISSQTAIAAAAGPPADHKVHGRGRPPAGRRR